MQGGKSAVAVLWNDEQCEPDITNSDWGDSHVGVPSTHLVHIHFPIDSKESYCVIIYKAANTFIMSNIEQKIYSFYLQHLFEI